MKLFIARDMAPRMGDIPGRLFLFNEEPIKMKDYNNEFWGVSTETGECMEIDRSNFPKITFENSPQIVDVNYV